MSRTPYFRPYLTDFVRPLFALFALMSVACAGTVTPPDSTPVYADDIGQGLEPVDVEHQSTNRPEPETLSENTVKSEAAPPPAESTTSAAPAAEEAAAETPATSTTSPEPTP